MAKELPMIRQLIRQPRQYPNSILAIAACIGNSSAKKKQKFPNEPNSPQPKLMNLIRPVSKTTLGKSKKQEAAQNTSHFLKQNAATRAAFASAVSGKTREKDDFSKRTQFPRLAFMNVKENASHRSRKKRQEIKKRSQKRPKSPPVPPNSRLSSAAPCFSWKGGAAISQTRINSKIISASLCSDSFQRGLHRGIGRLRQTSSANEKSSSKACWIMAELLVSLLITAADMERYL
jgi:hypothetical protein